MVENTTLLQPRQFDVPQFIEATTAEKRAEVEAIHIMMSRNISDLLSGQVSVNKLSANWRNYARASSSEVLEMLSKAKEIAKDFIAWWSPRDKAISVISMDEEFQKDVIIYVSKKILEFKLLHNGFLDPDARVIAYRAQRLKETREFLHESINRLRKQVKLDDDVADKIQAGMEEKIEELWNKTTLPLVHQLESALRGIKLISQG